MIFIDNQHADAATLGFWEIIGTPVELASGQELTTYVITYSSDDKGEDIKTYPSDDEHS